MKYSVYTHDRYTVFQLEEERMSIVIAPDLVSELLTLQVQGVSNLILDVSKVNYADSAGLSALMNVSESWKSWRPYCVFVVSGTVPHVKTLIDITHLDRVLLMAPTVQEAVELVFKEELRLKMEDNSDEPG